MGSLFLLLSLYCTIPPLHKTKHIFFYKRVFCTRFKPSLWHRKRPKFMPTDSFRSPSLTWKQNVAIKSSEKKNQSGDLHAHNYMVLTWMQLDSSIVRLSVPTHPHEQLILLMALPPNLNLQTRCVVVVFLGKFGYGLSRKEAPCFSAKLLLVACFEEFV